ncbi:hypothetical protein [Aquimarina rhabdastrellae]
METTTKNTIITGLFLITSTVIGIFVTWAITSNTYKVEIEMIRDNSISKEIVEDNYIVKEEYDKLIRDKKSWDIQKKIIIDSLKEELIYMKRKFVANEIEKFPRIEVDEFLYEFENVYQDASEIIIDIKVTNLGNDIKNGFNRYDTFIQTPDGFEYYITKILRGGRKNFLSKYEFKNMESVLYTISFGKISSQLKYDKLIFKGVNVFGKRIYKKMNVMSKK